MPRSKSSFSCMSSNSVTGDVIRSSSGMGPSSEGEWSLSEPSPVQRSASSASTRPSSLSFVGLLFIQLPHARGRKSRGGARSRFSGTKRDAARQRHARVCVAGGHSFMARARVGVAAGHGARREAGTGGAHGGRADSRVLGNGRARSRGDGRQGTLRFLSYSAIGINMSAAAPSLSS